MLATFRKDDGGYVDNAESHPQGFNPANLERHGLTDQDVIVVDAGEEPWVKRLVDGEVVDDTEKIAALQEEEASRRSVVEQKATRRAAAIQKLTALGLTEEEIAALVS